LKAVLAIRAYSLLAVFFDGRALEAAVGAYFY